MNSRVLLRSAWTLPPPSHPSCSSWWERRLREEAPPPARECSRSPRRAPTTPPGPPPHPPHDSNIFQLSRLSFWNLRPAHQKASKFETHGLSHSHKIKTCPSHVHSLLCSYVAPYCLVLEPAFWLPRRQTFLWRKLKTTNNLHPKRITSGWRRCIYVNRHIHSYIGIFSFV